MLFTGTGKLRVQVPSSLACVADAVELFSALLLDSESVEPLVHNARVRVKFKFKLPNRIPGAGPESGLHPSLSDFWTVTPFRRRNIQPKPYFTLHSGRLRPSCRLRLCPESRHPTRCGGPRSDLRVLRQGDLAKGTVRGSNSQKGLHEVRAAITTAWNRS